MKKKIPALFSAAALAVACSLPAYADVAGPGISGSPISGSNLFAVISAVIAAVTSAVAGIILFLRSHTSR